MYNAPIKSIRHACINSNPKGLYVLLIHTASGIILCDLRDRPSFRQVVGSHPVPRSDHNKHHHKTVQTVPLLGAQV